MVNPFISLGGCFDYSYWEDRDEFLELDKKIAKGVVEVAARTDEEVDRIIGRHTAFLERLKALDYL